MGKCGSKRLTAELKNAEDTNDLLVTLAHRLDLVNSHILAIQKYQKKQTDYLDSINYHAKQWGLRN